MGNLVTHNVAAHKILMTVLVTVPLYCTQWTLYQRVNLKQWKVLFPEGVPIGVGGFHEAKARAAVVMTASRAAVGNAGKDVREVVHKIVELILLEVVRTVSHVRETGGDVLLQLTPHPTLALMEC
jgi:hypothetical protein